MVSTMDSTIPFMPGSYLFQHDRNHKSNSHNIFQPPTTSPSPTQRYSQIPRPISRASSTSCNRKRPRLDTNTSYFSRPTRPLSNYRSVASTPFSNDGSYDHISLGNLDSSTYSLDEPNLLSPSPLANSEYRLAGGLDTPCASVERGLDELAQDEAERDYRFNRYTTTNTSRTNLSLSGSAKSALAMRNSDPDVAVGNDRKRIRSDAPSHGYSRSMTGWGIRSTAWALTGGLAGRMFNFCINTAFGGFRAGGGETYRMDVSISQPGGSTMMQDSMGVNSIFGSIDHSLSLSNGYTHDLGGFVEDYMNSPESRRRNLPTSPPIDQSQWGYDSLDRSAIKNDWQIIDQVSYNDSAEEHSPARKRSRASVAGNWQRPVSRNSMASRTTSTASASYASPRARSSVGVYQQERPMTNNSTQRVQRPRPSFTQSRRSHSHFPASTVQNFGYTSPERPSSAASLRKQRTSTNHQDSKLSPEVIDYKRKMRQQDRATDDNLRKLNAQLRDMIREGKEALGSKVEIFDDHGSGGVDGDIFDEGYYEDGWK